MYFGIFLLVVAVILKILKSLTEGDEKKSNDVAVVPAPSADDVAASNVDAEKKPPQQVVVVRRTSPFGIAAGIVTAVILLGVIIWAWGFFEAASDMEYGNMNLLKYGIRVQNMNPITRSGYDTYMENFTNIGESREQTGKIFE